MRIWEIEGWDKGTKIRAPYWGKNEFIVCSGSGFEDETGEHYFFDLVDLQFEHWEPVKEPREVWCVLNANNHVIRVHSTEADAREDRKRFAGWRVAKFREITTDDAGG